MNDVPLSVSVHLHQHLAQLYAEFWAGCHPDRSGMAHYFFAWIINGYAWLCSDEHDE